MGCHHVSYQQPHHKLVLLPLQFAVVFPYLNDLLKALQQYEDLFSSSPHL